VAKNRRRNKLRSVGATPAAPRRQPAAASAALGEAQGWTLFAHPCFLDQLESLLNTVEKEPPHAPNEPESANAKTLAAIVKLILDVIPSDPASKEFRQGGTLGVDRQHWFRAKFGGGRFRLFYRFRADARIVVYAWVNDESTLRTYGKRNDAYAVFGRMLNAGHPPDDWDALLEAAKDEIAVKRTARAAKRLRR
jgi:toxin YhaV